MRCFRLESASRPARSLRLLPAMLLCLAMLAGCRFGEQVGLFDDDAAIERAIVTLKQSIGNPVRVLNVSIAPNQIAMRVQDPNNRSHVDEWRLDRMHMLFVNWDRVSGPLPYQLTLVNPDLEANLFELGEIDFASTLALARAAVERAGLADKARVTHMEIARQVFALPAPASGEIRWTIDVNSARESVQVIADNRGTIVGMNIDGTERAKNLDILRQLDLIADAAKSFRFILGPDQILTRVIIAPRSISFETNVSDPSSPVPVSSSLNARRAYNWNLNGLQRATARVNADAAMKTRGATFSVDDADWAALPAIVASAEQQLAIPQGRVTAIELSRPDNPLGPAIVLWMIQVTGQNKETGFVRTDTAGNVKQVMLPQSLRKPVDYYDPATMADLFTKLGVDFGKDRQYAEITVLNDKVMITAQDHMLSSFSQIVLTDTGLQRVGAAAMAAAKNVSFRIGDLNALSPDRIRDLEAKTLETLKLPPKSISGITIGRGSADPSPNGNVTIEIKAEDKSSGRAGRVNYELDGTVIRAYLP